MRINLFNRAVHWVRAKLAYQINGAPVPPVKVKAACEVVVANAQAAMTRNAESLQSRSNVAAWYETHKQAIKDLTIAESALARGGWAQMRPADYARLEPKIAEQYAYARKFAEDVAKGRYGDVPSDDRRFLMRAGMYANRGRDVFEAERLAVHRESGFEECQRVRAAVDSCEDCIAWEALGWLPVDVMESQYPIGGARCLSNCHCVLIFRRGGTT